MVLNFCSQRKASTKHCTWSNCIFSCHFKPVLGRVLPIPVPFLSRRAEIPIKRSANTREDAAQQKSYFVLARWDKRSHFIWMIFTSGHTWSRGDGKFQTGHKLVQRKEMWLIQNLEEAWETLQHLSLRPQTQTRHSIISDTHRKSFTDRVHLNSRNKQHRVALW